MAVTSGSEQMGVPRGIDNGTRGVVATGSLIAAILGLAAIVLGVMGLFDISPTLMAQIAIIVIGAAFLIGGGAFISRMGQLANEFESPTDSEIVEEGMALESVLGIAGIVLGVLAWLGFFPVTLMATACIVLGGALMFGAEAQPHVRCHPAATRTQTTGTVETRGTVEPARTWVARAPRQSIVLSSGIDLLAGLAGIVLGILALVGTNPLMLILCSLIAFGVARLLSGFSLAGEFRAVERR